MLDDVRKLLEIQELDREILELKNQVARYPQIWEGVKQRLAKAREEADRAEKNLDRHTKERRRIEQKIRLFSEDLRRTQSQQSTVKTTKEYEAITKQTDALKTKLSQLEEQGLDLISKDEATNKAVEDSKAELVKAEEFYKSEKERIRVQFNEKKEQIASLERDKARLDAAVGPEAKQEYNRAFKSHPGSAVVPVRAKSCSGCHFGLLPNDLLQVHRGEEIVFCPACNRILSHDEEYTPAEQVSGSVH